MALNLMVDDPHFMSAGELSSVLYNDDTFLMHPLLVHELHAANAAGASAAPVDASASLAGTAFAAGNVTLGKPDIATAEADDWTVHGEDFWEDNSDPVEEITIDDSSFHFNKAEQREIIVNVADRIEDWLQVEKMRGMGNGRDYYRLLEKFEKMVKSSSPIGYAKTPADYRFHEALKSELRQRAGL